MAMSDGAKATFLLVSGLLSAVLIAPRLAGAQPAIADTTWAVLDVSAAMNRAIEESEDSAELREKAVRRMSECSLMYGGLSTLTTNLEAKKSYVQAQAATVEVEVAISKPLQKATRLELEESARRSVALMLRTIKTEGSKEVAPLLKSCKALNDVNEIKNALRDLSQQ
jgi:tRNA/tmRNA/rRNA uracil-C5-methylase (TrmA/RlmC/RlmD family)